MKSVLLLLLPICVLGQSSTTEVVQIPKDKPYQTTKQKIAAWSILALSSLTDGILEGYGFDGRRSFERKFGADPEGFWGSQSWRSVYKNGDPSQGHKSWVLKQTGAIDFYHLADDLRKIGYVSSGVLITLGEKKTTKEWIIDLTLSAAISASFKRAGMHWIRN